MNASYLHHLGVPCVAQIKTVDEDMCDFEKKFFLNPDAIIRIEPGGGMITPPMLYSSFIVVDKELLGILQSQEINSSLLTKNTFQILLDNKIILPDTPATDNYKKMEVSVKNLPAQALLELTSDCNCNCAHCYHVDDIGSHYPSINELKERIDLLKKFGIGLFEVTGGEAFLRKDLLKILSYLHDSDVHFYIVTNGYYLSDVDDDMINILKKSLGVAVSLDGVGDIHDKIRRKRGLYDRVIRGLDKMCSKGVNVYLISTINEKNIFIVEEMIKVAKKYNTTLHVRPTINTGSAKNEHLGENDIRQNLKPFLSHPNVRNGLLSTKKTIPNAKFFGCGIRKRISIDSKGFLYPCVMDRRRRCKTIKSYTPESLIEELNRESCEFLQKHEKCASCTINQEQEIPVCGGFCRFSKSYIKGE